MSLTRCFRQLGKNISPENRAAIQAAAAEFRAKGMSNQEAAVAAVRTHDGVLAEKSASLKKSPPKAAAAAGAEGGEPGQAGIARAAAEVATLNPDMLVQMEGMDAPMRVGDLLAKVKEEAAADVRDSKLVQVAAECALTS